MLQETFLPVTNGAGELQVQADAGRDASAWLNVTCDGRLPKRGCPSPSPRLPSPADARRYGQSAAHTKEELAYSLAQICSLNCVCAAPVFSTPPLCLTFFSFPLSAVISLFKCVFFLLFLHISLRSPSNHSVFIRQLLCELRGRSGRIDGGWVLIWRTVLLEQGCQPQMMLS